MNGTEYGYCIFHPSQFLLNVEKSGESFETFVSHILRPFSKWFIIYLLSQNFTLRKKCPYSELFWSAFSRIRTEYGEILRISPYSVQMRENPDQNNSEYGHFSCSVYDNN